METHFKGEGERKGRGARKGRYVRYEHKTVRGTLFALRYRRSMASCRPLHRHPGKIHLRLTENAFDVIRYAIGETCRLRSGDVVHRRSVAVVSIAERFIPPSLRNLVTHPAGLGPRPWALSPNLQGQVSARRNPAFGLHVTTPEVTRPGE